MSKLVLFPAIPWAGVQLRHSSPARGARKKLAEKLDLGEAAESIVLRLIVNWRERVQNRWLGASLSFNFLQLPSFVFPFCNLCQPLEFQQHLAYFDWSGGNRSGPGVIQISKWHPWWWKMRCFCWFSEGWFFRLGSTRKLPKEKKTRPRCFKDTKDMYLLNSFDVKEMEQTYKTRRNIEKHAPFHSSESHLDWPQRRRRDASWTNVSWSQVPTRCFHSQACRWGWCLKAYNISAN